MPAKYITLIQIVFFFCTRLQADYYQELFQDSQYKLYQICDTSYGLAHNEPWSSIDELIEWCQAKGIFDDVDYPRRDLIPWPVSEAISSFATYPLEDALISDSPSIRLGALIHIQASLVLPPLSRIGELWMDNSDPQFKSLLISIIKPYGHFDSSNFTSKGLNGINEILTHVSYPMPYVIQALYQGNQPIPAMNPEFRLRVYKKIPDLEFRQALILANPELLREIHTHPTRAPKIDEIRMYILFASDKYASQILYSALERVPRLITLQSENEILIGLRELCNQEHLNYKTALACLKQYH